MNIPGYDAWKLAGPDDDRNSCPYCGSHKPGVCPAYNTDEPDELIYKCDWLVSQEESEPDPDYLRDIANEDKMEDR